MIEDLIDLENKTKKEYELIIRTNKQQVEIKIKENLSKIESYLINQYETIKMLDHVLYVGGKSSHDKQEKISGFCLVFNGHWLITEEGIFYDTSTGFKGEDYYYVSDGRYNWIPISELYEHLDGYYRILLTDTNKGLFVIWNDMKKKLYSDLEKIAKTKLNKVNRIVDNNIRATKNIMNFEV